VTVPTNSALALKADKSVVDGLTTQMEERETEVTNIISPSFYDGAVISLIDDDGTIEFLNKYKPLLDARGLKATIACVTGQVGISGVGNVLHMDKNQLQSLQNEGFEISSHSVNHQSTVFRDNLTSVSDSTIDDEMRLSQQWLKDNDFKGYNNFIYPYGDFATDQALRFKKIARKYYKLALNSIGSHNNSPVDNMYLNRTKLDITKDFTTVIKPIIDNCVTNKGWLILYTHSWDTSQFDVNYITTVLDYIQSLNIPVMTVGEAEKIKGNSLSVGEFTDSTNKVFIGKNGSLLIATNVFTNGLVINTTNPDHLLVENSVNDGVIRFTTTGSNNYIQTGTVGSHSPKNLVLTGYNDAQFSLLRLNASRLQLQGTFDTVGAITEAGTTLANKYQAKPTSGSGAPTTTPTFIGQDYIDTTNKKVYKACGTGSSDDWVVLN
jgi:peptidoglycan/xylan/chitin deacetylase (PgdA/CDA1 family)